MICNYCCILEIEGRSGVKTKKYIIKDYFGRAVFLIPILGMELCILMTIKASKVFKKTKNNISEIGLFSVPTPNTYHDFYSSFNAK